MPSGLNPISPAFPRPPSTSIYRIWTSVILSRRESWRTSLGVVQQLKKELEKELDWAKNEVERYGAALVALGSKAWARRRSLRGVGRRLSAAARRKISLAQKAGWAKWRNK